MLLIRINRKIIKRAGGFLLAAIFIFSIFSYFQNRRLANTYELLFGSSDMMEQASLAAFLTVSGHEARQYKTVEIFDVKQERVVKRISSNPFIQGEAEKFLKGITGLYVKVNALPKDGFIIRIPLETEVKIQEKWLNEPVEEVFLIFPEQEAPYLLVLDSKKRPFFFTFEGNTAPLLKELEFELQSTQ